MVDVLKLTTKDLRALVKYKDILDKNKSFKRGFWAKEKDQVKGIKHHCMLYTKYCLENLAKIPPEKIPEYGLNEIKDILSRYKLLGMVQIVFNHDVLAILKNAYAEEFRARTFKEWMWSKRGLWHDDKLIIEAVEDMVRKEGIRWIKDIPRYDWKRRLIKHGIYNVLSYFNWSIYSLFNFVYPNKFHPSDFKYKTKWASKESLENAFRLMHKTFKSRRLSVEDIILLGTSDFRRMGLAGMLISAFNSSVLKAKEFYLYKTVDHEDNQKELLTEMERIRQNRQDDEIRRRIQKVATGKFIYNLHQNSTLYGYIKRHARKQGLSIDDFLSKYGFVYKSAKKEVLHLTKEEIWDLRKQGFTYVQIAEHLGSNPTTVSEFCKKNFGGDPLIPRPLEDYVTVQELMNRYHVDHKTIMKLVSVNTFENHTTIRFRYLKKSEIEPALQEYIRNNRRHIFMCERYGN